MQEDKEPLFDTLDTTSMLLPIVAGVIDTLQVNEGAMRSAMDDTLLATDLADYLVRRGLPFREAHRLLGKAILLSEKRGKKLGQLEYADYQAISPAFGTDLYDSLDFEASVEARDVIGGTALSTVRDQLEKAKALLEGMNKAAR